MPVFGFNYRAFSPLFDALGKMYTSKNPFEPKEPYTRYIETIIKNYYKEHREIDSQFGSTAR